MTDVALSSLSPNADVREVLYLADITMHQRAKRINQPLPPDAQPTAADLWWAIVNITRPFSVAARFLKGLGLNSRTLKHQLKPLVQGTTEGASYTPTQWQALATSQAQHLNDTTVRLPHLLLALLAQDDGTATAVQHGLTAEKINAIDDQQREKVAGMSRHTWNQLAFYCRETIEMVVVMVFFLIVIKEGIGELRLIPSESMVPGLQIGDRLIIEKLSKWVRPPQRGDIVVFYPPEPDAILHNDPLSWVMRSTGFSSLFHNSAEDPIDKAYIKRLIGLPGDTVWVINNQGVMVNDKLLDEPYVNEVALSCGNICLPIEVPEGYYYMMGDNRNRSKDGRFFGFVPQERMLGRAVFRLWPLDRVGTLK